MGANLLSAARAPAQPLASITAPTIATVADLARRIAAVDRALDRLSDERFDDGSAPLLAERCRLLDTLAGTGARTLTEVATKLRLAAAELRDGDTDEAAFLLAGAIGDLGRLDGS